MTEVKVPVSDVESVTISQPPKEAPKDVKVEKEAQKVVPGQGQGQDVKCEGINMHVGAPKHCKGCDGYVDMTDPHRAQPGQ